MGVLGTLALHAALFQASVLGNGPARKDVPDDAGAGASAAIADGRAAMTLLIVHLPSVHPSSSMTLDVTSSGVAPRDPVMQVISPDPGPVPALDAVQAEPEAESFALGDAAERAALYGRYTGQIQARIERAWRKPVSKQQEEGHVGEAWFRCPVRIRQDEEGRVTEVELLSCNGTPEWQQSLVHAIQAASPLPSPSHPAVFSNALVLVFEARAVGMMVQVKSNGDLGT